MALFKEKFVGFWLSENFCAYLFSTHTLCSRLWFVYNFIKHILYRVLRKKAKLSTVIVECLAIFSNVQLRMKEKDRIHNDDQFEASVILSVVSCGNFHCGSIEFA